MTKTHKSAALGERTMPGEWKDSQQTYEIGHSLSSEDAKCKGEQSSEGSKDGLGEGLGFELKCPGEISHSNGNLGKVVVCGTSHFLLS